MSPIPIEKILEAVSFAARAHRPQTRKDGQTPYAAHVFRVGLIVRDLFGFDDPRMLLTAILHDTIEDTTTDFDDIAEHFGGDIARWVAVLSKDKTLPDEDRERAYMAKLAAAPWQVKACKLADMFDNGTDSNHTTPQQREKTLRRLKGYFSVLSRDESPELCKPLKLVCQLLEKMETTR